MTTVNNHGEQPNTEQVRALLSPYLDGEVTAEERMLVEEAVAGSPELRRDLETLRQTVSLLETLPPVPAPRPFTLSEAEVGRVGSAPRRLVVPPWLRSWAVVAATFLCVLALGGFFVVQQFGGIGSAPAEIALEQRAAEPEAVPADEETFNGAPTEIVIEKQTELETAKEAEEPAAELAEEAVPQPEAEEAPALTAPPAQKEAALAEAPQAEDAPEEAGEEAVMAAEAPPEDQATEPAGEMADEEPLQREEAGVMEEEAVASAVEADDGATPTPGPEATPLPVAGMAVPTASPPAVAEQALEAEEAAPLETEIAPPTEPDLPVDALDVTPRPVEVQNQVVEIRPGVIKVEGQIEAPPGSMLLAGLHRNGELFDQWADPASLRTVVQPGGRFSFLIQARPDRNDQNLFQVEPAEYRVDITAVGLEEPVTASVFFDTAGPAVPPTLTATTIATATTQPTPTFTPSPSPTPAAETADKAGATDVAAAITPDGSQPELPAQPSQATPPVTAVVLVGLVAFGVLVVIGGITWWLVRKRQG